MKVAELEGTQLDYWVAKIEGRDMQYWGVIPRDAWYSTRWECGGPIIERERIALFHDSSPFPNGIWQAYFEAMQTYDGLEGRCLQFGATALIAAMRAYVASKFGDTVEDSQPKLLDSRKSQQ